MAITVGEALSLPKRIESVLPSLKTQGAGVLIVDSTGENILVIEELSRKSASLRAQGQISPPLETAKTGPLGFGRERRNRTIKAALLEVVNEKTLPYVSGHLRRVQLPQQTIVELTPSIRADLAIFVYNGPLLRSLWGSTAENETQRPHWVNIDSYLQSMTARPWGRRLVELARKNSLLRPSVLTITERSNPLFGIFSLQKFYQRRERRSDISLT